MMRGRAQSFFRRNPCFWGYQKRNWTGWTSDWTPPAAGSDQEQQQQQTNAQNGQHQSHTVDYGGFFGEEDEHHAAVVDNIPQAKGFDGFSEKEKRAMESQQMGGDGILRREGNSFVVDPSTGRFEPPVNSAWNQNDEDATAHRVLPKYMQSYKVKDLGHLAPSSKDARCSVKFDNYDYDSRLPRLYGRCDHPNPEQTREELTFDKVLDLGYDGYFSRLLTAEVEETIRSSTYIWSEPFKSVPLNNLGIDVVVPLAREPHTRHEAKLQMRQPARHDKLKPGQGVVLFPASERESLQLHMESGAKKQKKGGHQKHNKKMKRGKPVFGQPPSASPTGTEVTNVAQAGAEFLASIVKRKADDVIMGIVTDVQGGGEVVDVTAKFVLPARGSKRFVHNVLAARIPRDDTEQPRKALEMLVATRGKLALSSYILRNKSGAQEENLIFPDDSFNIWNGCKSIGLNPSQIEAAKESLLGQNPVTLIQGPPGTGKTTVSALIIATAVYKGCRVIACGASNAAVDNLCRKLIELRGLLCADNGMRDKAQWFDVLRYESSTRARYFSDDPDMPTVSRLVDAKVQQVQKDGGWKALKEQYGKTTPGTGKKKHGGIHKGVQQDLIDRAQVICCTCAGAAEAAIVESPGGFPLVLMDEASQVVEPYALLPLLAGMKRLVVVGDPKQLGAVIKTAPLPGQLDQHPHLGLSLFERLVKEERLPMHMLNVQYRMNPNLARFSNERFYNNELTSGVSYKDRVPTNAVHWQWGGCIAFHDTGRNSPLMGQEEQPQRGRIINPIEAQEVVKVVESLVLQGRVRPHEIGVMTPYDGQRNLLRELLHSKYQVSDHGNALAFKHGVRVDTDLFQWVDIDSIDSFQGREKEYIVFSTVRTESVGFLNDERRANVALTRAKRGLVVLGDRDLLTHRTKEDSIWRHFMKMISKPVPIDPENPDGPTQQAQTSSPVGEKTHAADKERSNTTGATKESYTLSTNMKVAKKAPIGGSKFGAASDHDSFGGNYSTSDVMKDIKANFNQGDTTPQRCQTDNLDGDGFGGDGFFVPEEPKAHSSAPLKGRSIALCEEDEV